MIRRYPAAVEPSPARSNIYYPADRAQRLRDRPGSENTRGAGSEADMPEPNSRERAEAHRQQSLKHLRQALDVEQQIDNRELEPVRAMLASIDIDLRVAAVEATHALIAIAGAAHDRLGELGEILEDRVI